MDNCEHTRVAMFAMRLAALLTFAARASAGSQPNIVYILADDLDWDYKQDRLALMPNLLEKVVKKGAHFENHVAAVPVCGPSRSSLLVGRYPHNTGYFANLDRRSLRAYRKIQNNTVGTWLTSAGYHTAFIGKYVNGLETEVASGWNYWGSISSHKNLYNFYNASSWDVTFDDKGEYPVSEVKDRLWTGIHQADWIPQVAETQIKAAKQKGKPFYLHLTPTMIHYGTCYGPHASESKYARDDPYWEKQLEQFGCERTKEFHCRLTVSPCVTDRNKKLDKTLVNPHVPAYNVSATGLLPDAMQLGPLSDYVSQRQDIGFRNRTGSARDLDDMIGAVLKAVRDAGEEDNTYVIFTSDNGFHLGEHRMPAGKQHPYETDVRVPFYMKGPGIPENVRFPHPSTHLDVTATIVDIAGATPAGPPLDGKSFMAELSGTSDARAWRNFSFSEHFQEDLTWWMIRSPLDGGDFGQTSFHWWCTGQAEVFDLKADPWQLTNLVSPSTPRGEAVKDAYMGIGVALSECSGHHCNRAKAARVPRKPLHCKKTGRGFDPDGADDPDAEQLARISGRARDMAYISV